MSRFDARLPEEQKQLFEYASKIGGFRSLTDFIITSLQAKAEEIIEKHNSIITSKKDQEVFFDALQAEAKPNKKLKSALAAFNKRSE